MCVGVRGIINDLDDEEIAKMTQLISGQRFSGISIVPRGLILAASALLVSCAISTLAADVATAAETSNAADEAGFQSLLGEDAKQLWRGYKEEGWPASWKLEDGVLARVSDGGDIMTVEEFADFDLRLEWKNFSRWQ